MSMEFMHLRPLLSWLRPSPPDVDPFPLVMLAVLVLCSAATMAGLTICRSKKKHRFSVPPNNSTLIIKGSHSLISPVVGNFLLNRAPYPWIWDATLFKLHLGDLMVIMIKR